MLSMAFGELGRPAAGCQFLARCGARHRNTESPVAGFHECLYRTEPVANSSFLDIAVICVAVRSAARNIAPAIREETGSTSRNTRDEYW